MNPIAYDPAAISGFERGKRNPTVLVLSAKPSGVNCRNQINAILFGKLVRG